MPSILINEQEPVYQQTANLIRAMIFDNNWSTGQKIPSYRKIAQTLDVSYVTVKKAVDLLVVSGVLERSPGKNCVVARFQAEQMPFQRREESGLSDASNTPQKVMVPQDLVGHLENSGVDSKSDVRLPIRFITFTGLPEVMQDEIGRCLAIGLETTCARNLQPLLFHCVQRDGRLYHLSDQTLNQPVQGTVCLRPFNNRYLIELARRCPRIVSVDRDATGFCQPSIVTDNESGALLATTRLLEAGHSKIAYLGTGLGDQTAAGTDPAMRERFKGFCMAHLLKSNEVDMSLCMSVSNWGDFENAIRRLGESGRSFSALVAYDCGVAGLAKRCLEEKGIRVPEDCSVVGAGGIAPGGDIAGSYFDLSRLPHEVNRLLETFDGRDEAELVELQPTFKTGKTFSPIG